MKLSKFKNRGFTLLFAVLTASVLLSLALVIFSQMYKTLLLSSASKESLAAFYAADSGAECALYWDLKHEPIATFPDSIFATSTGSADYRGSDSITCNGQKFNKSWIVNKSSNPATTNFDLYFNDDGVSPPEVFPTEGCTKVVVSKTENSGIIITTIESRGYNICGSSPRKVERAIRVTY